MLALALEVFRLTEIDLGPWRVEGTHRMIEFPAPRGIAGKHVRLVLERAAKVNLNGSALGVGREFDVTDLAPTGNRVSTSSDAGTARLLVTPRVFASRAQRSGRGVSVTIRNTLENTANVAVTVRSTGASDGPSVAATLGPGTTHTVEIGGPLPKDPLEVLVQKEEEAVEGQYQFVAGFDMIFGTGTER